MIERISFWLAPSTDDPDLARRQYLLNVVLLGLSSTAFLFGLAMAVMWALGKAPAVGALSGFGVQPFYLLAYWLSRRGRVRLASYLPVIILFLVMVGGGYQLGVGHVTLVGYAMAVVAAGILIGPGVALVFTMLSVIAYMVTGLLQMAGMVPGALAAEATVVADSVGLGLGLVVVVILDWLSTRQMDEALHREQELSAELRAERAELERRVAERTRDLERRAVQLETAARVSREAAAIRDVEQLLVETVHLISESFGFYHAGIFLLDEMGEYAVLRAASSEGGRHMLERGHKLKVGEVGIVGHVSQTGEPRIALDVGADAVFFNNPDLPDTRSEIGLPLRMRQRVIGVLDVQSTEEAAFSVEDVAVLQTLAEQVALAIDNARLLEESNRALHELEIFYGRQVREVWQGRVDAYRYTGGGVEPVPDVAHVSSFVHEDDERQLTASIRLRGQTLGAIALRPAPEREAWSPDEISLVEQVTTQVALALENARLLEETMRRAEREQTISDMTSRFTRSLDVDGLLRTAVRELGRVLKIDDVSIHVGTPEMPPSSEELEEEI